MKLDVAKQLGQGGFARVFKTDLNGNPVAVKVIKTPFDKEGKRIPLTEGKLLRYSIVLKDFYDLTLLFIHI